MELRGRICVSRARFDVVLRPEGARRRSQKRVGARSFRRGRLWITEFRDMRTGRSEGDRGYWKPVKS